MDFTQDFFGKRRQPDRVRPAGGARPWPWPSATSTPSAPPSAPKTANTPRHAAEFWMIEPEIAFADLNDDMELAEAMVKYVIRYVLDNCPGRDGLLQPASVDKGLHGAAGASLLHCDFARVTYTEAVELLEKNNDNFEYQGRLGHRPADRARALPHRADLRNARCSSPTTPRRSRPSTCA